MWKQAKEHKYIARVRINPIKYRYFYTREEYDSYLHDKGEQSQNDIKQPYQVIRSANFNSARATGSNQNTESARESLKKTLTFVSKTINKLSNEIANGQSIKNVITSNIDNMMNSKLANTVKDKVNKWYSDLKEIDEKNKQQKKEATAKAEQEKLDRKHALKEAYKNTSDEEIDAKKKQASSDKTDNNFTDEETIAQLKKSKIWKKYVDDGYINNSSTAKEIEEVLKDRDDMTYNETLSDFANRMGCIDETQKGYHPESFDVLKHTNSDIDDDLDMEYVNSKNLNHNGDPDVNGDGYPDTFAQYGYSHNCAYCTLAYDFRQRGYDVEASAKFVDTSNTLDEISSWYKGGGFHSSSGIKDTLLAINDQPDGSRGQLCMVWKGGGGHSVVYEKVNGKTYIRDCQSNKKYTLQEYYDRYDGRISISSYMRTDNLEFTDKALNGVKNRK